MKRFLSYYSTFLIILFMNCLSAVAAEDPIIVLHSNAYAEVGTGNQFSAFLSTYETGTYQIDMGNGPVSYEVVPGEVNTDTEDEDATKWIGTWIPFSANAEGVIKIYGDASNLNIVCIDGGYVDTIDMTACTELKVISLEHNALTDIDLSPFTKLYALYLTDNPFTQETPLKVGPNKPYLSILEIDIVDWLDPSFNLSDYPSMQAFDGYHNQTLYNVDPTGCPDLLVMSIEMAPVSTLDVTQNKKLRHLNISETRITEIDLTQNTELRFLLAGNVSGTINSDCNLEKFDLSQNTELIYLDLSGNDLESIDLSPLTNLSYLHLNYNYLSSLDLTGLDALYSLYVRDNNMDFATLPWPDGYGEYVYQQRAMPVPRVLAAGSPLDLSARVLRDGTTTTAQVWRQVYGADDELLDNSLYTYADGVITFNQALADSVCVEYLNDVFTDNHAKTTRFMVKDASEIGKPSAIASFTPKSSPVSMHVGMANASAETPKEFLIDFGNGVLQPFTSASSLDYDSEGTLATGTSTGTVTIYIPEGEVMTALSLAQQPLSSIDITKASEVVRLDLSGCQLQQVDLKFNRCLQELYLSNNNLSQLDLQGVYGDFEKNLLHTLDASNNAIESVNVIATYAMQHLNLSHNRLAEIDLRNYDNLLTLNLSYNQLTLAPMSHLLAATEANFSHNDINYVDLCTTYLVQGVDLSYNKLTYPTLPLTSQMGDGYIYAPQQEIVIPAKGIAVNLKEYSATVDGAPTCYTWKKADGTALSADTDYTVSGYTTTFHDATLGQVYCELTNAAFPQLTGEKALCTTQMEIIERPSFLVAFFTTQAKSTSSSEIILAASEPLQLYLDWTGNEQEMQPYAVETSYKTFELPSIPANAEVSIYADKNEDAAKISIFSIYNLKLNSVDLTALTSATSINLGGTQLTAENISLPDAPNMYDMNLQGNKLTEFPFASKFPQLAMLNLSSNKLVSFDCSTVPSVGYLVLSNNSITDITFNSDKLWSLFIDNNKLESINLSGLPNIEQILLNNNKLSQIDLEPVSKTLRVINLASNEFTFTTLPLPNEYSNLSVYYYGNQAVLPAECIDGKVDLSSQVVAGGYHTEYSWYLGYPEYDSDQQTYVGTLLEEDVDYVIDDGVTTFLTQPSRKVCCMMVNEALPNLYLFTSLISVKVTSIDSAAADASLMDVYNLQGIRVLKAATHAQVQSLPSGIYIIDRKKTLIK